MKLRTWAKVLLATVLICISLGFFVSKPIPVAPVYTGEVKFDTDQAMRYLANLVTRFPRRDYASPQRLKAADWIWREMSLAGLEVRTQEFSEVIAGQKISGLRNVYAVLPGQRPEAILVVGHYDIPPFVEQGAGDDGSGVAAVMELARIFAAEPTPRWTMIFMASDSEEYGAMWGSRKFLEESGWKGRLKAVVTLDFANMGRMKGIQVRSMGIQQGYTPLWLRNMAAGAAARETTALDVSSAMEWVERSVAISPTEHGVYLRGGIPAVDLAGVPQDQDWQSADYHTTADTLGTIFPDTMEKYGRTAERLLRGLQGLNRMPAREMVYLKTGSRYLPGWGVRLIQLAALLPLLFGVVVFWRRAGFRRWKEAWQEVRHFLAVFGAGILGYLALWAASEIGLMTKYELYPATQKDPVLNQPEVLPVALAVLAVAAGYLLLRRVLRVTSGGSPEVRQAVLLTGMLALAVTCVFFNAGFAAVAFLAPAIIFWPLVSSDQDWLRRGVNLLLALSVLVVFGGFILLFAKLYFIGHIWWYLLMGIAYGLFRVRAVLVFLAAAALTVRFIQAAAAAPTVSQKLSAD